MECSTKILPEPLSFRNQTRCIKGCVAQAMTSMAINGTVDLGNGSAGGSCMMIPRFHVLRFRIYDDAGWGQRVRQFIKDGCMGMAYIRCQAIKLWLS